MITFIAVLNFYHWPVHQYVYNLISDIIVHQCRNKYFQST